jgi:hypothetical protein
MSKRAALRAGAHQQPAPHAFGRAQQSFIRSKARIKMQRGATTKKSGDHDLGANCWWSKDLQGRRDAATRLVVASIMIQA